MIVLKTTEKPRSKRSFIRLWVGTDALTLVKFPPGDCVWHVRIIFRRIFYRLFWRVFDVHWVVSPRLIPYLKAVGISEKKIDVAIDDTPCSSCLDKCKPQKHDGVNVLYYKPKRGKNFKFKQWIYGTDIIETAQEIVEGVNWIEADGSLDMCKTWPIIDAYVRPNRHDGNPRMVMEAKLLGVPFYWREDFEPSACELVNFIEEVKLEKSI